VISFLAPRPLPNRRLRGTVRLSGAELMTVLRFFAVLRLSFLRTQVCLRTTNVGGGCAIGGAIARSEARLGADDRASSGVSTL
jgi:hypothetical protein